MKYFYVLFCATLLFSCDRFGNQDKKESEAARIVVISKQYNEIIWGLGAQQPVVAVDISSTYPEEVKKLPTVGYHRALSAEGILSMKPTLILHDNNIAPEHVVKQLEELGIPMKTFENKANDIEGTRNLIKEIGAYFHKEQKAQALCDSLDADMASALESAKQYADTPRVMVIHFGQATNAYLLVTGKSIAGKMVEWAGGRMAINDDKGMKKLSAEIVAASDPDVILVTDEGMSRLGSVEKVKELPGVAGTKAAKDNRIFTVDRHDIIYLGPGSGKSVLKIEQLIHRGEKK